MLGSGWVVVFDECGFVERQDGPRALTVRECSDPRSWYRRLTLGEEVMCPRLLIKRELKADCFFAAKMR